MIGVLLRVQLRALLGRLLGGGRRGGSAKGSLLKKLGFGLLMLYCLGVFAFMFGMFFAQLAAPCHMLGMDWLYFAMTALPTLTLMVVGSVFMSKSILYEAKDNELLLSLPLSPAAILASRLAALWVYNAVFGLMVAGPSGVIWAAEVGFTLGGAVCFVLLFLCLPLLALAISCILGWLLALLSSRVRSKALFSTLFGLLFLGAYMLLYTRVFAYIQALAANVDVVAGALSAAVPLVWLGRAAAEGWLPGLLGALACILAPFALVYWLLAATFIRTATTRRGLARIEYKEKTQPLRSPGAALLWRESRRFFTSAAYMLNAGLGLVFMAAAAVYAAVCAGDIRAVLTVMSGLSEAAGPLLALLLCMMQSMVLISASSLSLEGRNLWLLQSLPVTPRQCLFSKVGLHLVLTAPVTLFSGLVAGLALGLPAVQLVLVLTASLLYCAVVALLGTVLNLLLPRFDWVNEMTAVKQGASVMLTMLLAFLGVLGPAMAYLLWLGPMLASVTFVPGTGSQAGPVLFLAALALLYGLIAAALERWLSTAGAKRFTLL